MLFLAVKGARQWLISIICGNPDQASGACHRSLQLIHLLESNGWNLETIEHPASPDSRWATVAYGLRAILRHGPLQPLGIDSLRSQGHVSHWVQQMHSRYPKIHGVIQEGTGYGSLCAVAEWRRRGVCTVLVPANIESLAPNTDSWTHRSLDVSVRFAHERRWWAMAVAIFTISVEEAWWLQLHGIAAEHLPYYPAPAREQQLLAIRSQRQPDPSVGWMWLADFANPANRAAAPLTVEWLEHCSHPPQALQIAGRGCRWLQQTFAERLPSYAHVLGEVSDTELEQLYRRCTAQLLVHPATSGMLTRVVDAALTEIPVVGNTMALKNYGSCFADQVVSQPHRPLAAEACFLSTLAR